MKELLEKTQSYLDYVKVHYKNVNDAWAYLQTAVRRDEYFVESPIVGKIISDNIKDHDKSKLSDAEFIQYRNKFRPVEKAESLVNSFKFEEAWRHHKDNNGHHWETWTRLRSDRARYIYRVEMICDWLAMSRGGESDAISWWENERKRITGISEKEESHISLLLDQFYVYIHELGIEW